ncbi:MAG: potassium-transporting ATPase subunit KdpA, partial [Enterocloster bolteae]
CLLKWCFCFNLFFTLIFLLIFVVLLVGALSFFPALSLGPVAEFFQMIA